MPKIRRCKHRGCHNPAYLPNHYCSVHIAEEAKLKENKFKFSHSKRKTRYYNQVVRKRNPIKAKQNKFYHSKEWTKLRELILKRDYYLCQYCKALNIQTTGNIVDHVLPVERFSGHMRDGKNLVTCCKECHYWKTRWEEKYYGTGLHGKPTGNPPVNNTTIIAKQFNALHAEKLKNRF